MLLHLHPREALRDTDHPLQLADGDGDGALVLALRLPGLLAHVDPHVADVLCSLLGEPGVALGAGVADVLLELVHGEGHLDLARIIRLPHVQLLHVPSHHLVTSLISQIADEEDHIKSRQDGGCEVHLIVGLVHGLIKRTKDRIRRRQHRAPAVQHRGDPRFGNGDRLLLHSLVDGHPVVGAHLVELVEADDAAVGEDHGATFQGEVAVDVTDDGCGQTCRRGSLPGGIHADRRRVMGELQELGLRHPRIPQQQHMHIPPQAGPILVKLPPAPEQHTSDGLLHQIRIVRFAPDDARGDALADLLDHVPALGQLLELLLLVEVEVQGPAAGAAGVAHEAVDEDVPF
mmetsp:Transcript_34612/g.83547  ORF Transcript_34612/g.83547 Transcript_34612/m.83547 type:complete len:345 (+) Transcript_34612:460-1494(+)